ncbi:dihydropteroate synthase [Amycolatopsis rhabdoformis]|uniref:Dihydropteroate synthase n=1 Tax=Amycolatopsis rhabdoformis TaxID=1448059 RepID=A0ABZ1IL61_9PSEU|nr:dihydropteroate synthase [Amycolatopsis rhabdoformis]WSE35157.1 dihydropteroate synthase [Amycolatopsis rhabdoformis]
MIGHCGLAAPDSAFGPAAGSRCLVLGVLNVTPDSFSDGGRHRSVAAAVHHGLELAATGADLVDVGGESTRPGAARIPLAEELARVLPVVRELAGAGVRVSIDTMRSAVAAAAVDAGAVLVNDVSGGRADPAMARCVAELGTPYVATHWRAPSADMAAHSHYGDVVTEVVAELRDRLAALTAAGVRPERIVLDPGLGFAKTAEQSWQILRHLDALHELGQPVLVGASRKSFLAAFGPSGGPGREHATTAISTLAAARGAFAVRVHDVAASAVAVRVAAALAVSGAAAGDLCGRILDV